MKNGTSKQISRKTTESSSKGNFNIAFTLVLVTVGIVTYQLFTLLIHQRKQLLKKESNKDRREKTEDKETAKIEEKKTEDKETAKIEEKKTEDKATKKRRKLKIKKQQR